MSTASAPKCVFVTSVKAEINAQFSLTQTVTMTNTHNNPNYYLPRTSTGRSSRHGVRRWASISTRRRRRIGKRGKKEQKRRPFGPRKYIDWPLLSGSRTLTRRRETTAITEMVPGSFCTEEGRKVMKKCL
jgi:hypothetical protein